ncbi:MAG: 30S ribosomal protein S6 [Planctomycetota bacterium]|nr:MAG: 30S ribosomal protein S6 [Planctomycetota bacterium]
MSETGVNYYEGMFVFAQARDLGEGVDRVLEIFDRAGAEVLAMSKWDERRFAYPIKKHKRGVYVLTHFACPADKLAQIERDCNLSEEILRALILRADHLSEEEMRAHDARDELARDIEERRERAKARAAERAARLAASEAQEQEKTQEGEPSPAAQAEASAQA